MQRWQQGQGSRYGRGRGSQGLPPSGASGSEAEHRLFERLFEDYNEIIRPVANVSDAVIIQFEVSMSQLVKVVSARPWGLGCWAPRSAPRVSSDLPLQDEVNQIMETNLWLKQVSEPARALLPPGGHYVLCGSVREQGQRPSFLLATGRASPDWLCCLFLVSESLGPPAPAEGQQGPVRPILSRSRVQRGGGPFSVVTGDPETTPLPSPSFVPKSLLQSARVTAAAVGSMGAGLWVSLFRLRPLTSAPVSSRGFCPDPDK